MKGNATLTLPAPAKLNRMLHIVGKRPDGYHELQTLFQFLEHGDTLHFRLRDDDAITLSPQLDGVSAEDNLIVRAARLLQGTVGQPLPGVDIALEKRLPMGGGLGGGSSNAATTLLALDHLWQLNLDTDTLATLGLTLGADVPVFVRGFAAWGEGVGERLVPAPLDTPWFVVVHPGVSVSTAGVFGHPQLTRDTPLISMSRALQGGHNDCEAVVRRLEPGIGEVIDLLRQHGPAMLTGTGACVFCPIEEEAAALELEREILYGIARHAYPDRWSVFGARGCNISPLHQALNRLRVSSSTGVS
ncbi:4-(cytidine 5'-diphospho)-2-C-methyl-D-erythritol kinase [Kushneria indalinina]|uniref:4-diphosphocytidyl-2-C-methyl-D-erythritol kinase n=1 Tax=Kushneria indalinina DSM 14324 TaxID=1122140 RepID=A0A3D9E242_9GAMM|nr:4-(cytidine 5'-diphospho)-2-C-methyl-D-erythritol kinase [Kushneria indalinina]REC96589.1 4-diphosphocytidyl-2-C-methyl-D-erythritol kinase [Kushneria indalinina DSM 14324]